jgi:hypothetical protein
LVEGLGSGTLTAFGSTSAVRVKVKAGASPSLDPFTTTATAHPVSNAITAAASPTLSAFTSSSTAAVRIKAASSLDIGSFVSAAATKALVEGFGSGLLNDFSASATAKVPIKATSHSSLNVFGSSAQAAVKIKGSTVLRWGPLTVTATLVGAPAPPVPASRVVEIIPSRATAVVPGGRGANVSIPGRSYTVSRPRQTVLARGSKWRG